MVIAETANLTMGDAGQLQALADILAPAINQLSIVVGGIFGLYVIFTVFRIYNEHKRTKVMEDIRYNLDQLNMHYNIAYSRQRVGILRRIARWIHDHIQRAKPRNKGRDEL